MQLQPGATILNGKYRIERLLGEGASSQVWLATHTILRGQRALKILRTEMPGVGSTLIADYRDRFELEGQLQERVKGNPRIVAVLEADAVEGAPVLVMEYVEGGSLQKELDDAALRGAHISSRRCAEVLRDLAEGLDALHIHGWVHRDVKPSNALLDARGRAKIGDLGLAQTDLTANRSGLGGKPHPGTPGYRSPEHDNLQAYLTPAADVFALGVIGYRMLLGRLPDPPTAERPASLPEARAAGWLAALITEMLAWDPRARPANGGIVAGRIEAGLQAEHAREAEVAARAATLRDAIRAVLGKPAPAQAELTQADGWVDELLRLTPDDAEARALDRKVARALRDAVTAVEQSRAAEAATQAAAEQARLAREAEQRRLREAEVAAAAEQKRKADEAAWQRREEDQRQRLAAEATRKATETAPKAALPLAAPQGSTQVAASPSGANTTRRAVLIAAAGAGALGLGWLATRSGGEAPLATPTPAPTQNPPTLVPTATNTRPSPTAAPTATNTSPPPTATPNSAFRRIGADRAILTLAQGVDVEFVLVPAGEFVMGSDKAKDSLAFDDELPQHRLNLGEYWIAKTEVTVAQFAAFARAANFKTQAEKDGRSFTWTGSEFKEMAGADWAHPGGPATDVAQKQTHPVNHMSWDDALAFCGWASKLGGGEVLLPSEAEWEKAARGPDGRIYPWGNEAPDDTRLNYNQNIKDTTPVGRYGARWQSPYGCDDMAGNVWEWTRSLWGKDSSKPEFGYPYTTRQAEREDVQASRDVLRVLRGGSFDASQVVRCACRGRNYPYFHLVFYGFRVILRPPSL